MSVSKYSDKQIEVANVLRSLDIPQSNIDEIITMLEDTSHVEQKSSEVDDANIKLKLLSEQDWRKRAALSALLISRSLDN